jgi:hypothetical protein
MMDLDNLHRDDTIVSHRCTCGKVFKAPIVQRYCSEQCHRRAPVPERHSPYRGVFDRGGS